MMGYCNDFVCVLYDACIYINDCENCLFNTRVETQCPACQYEKVCSRKNKTDFKPKKLVSMPIRKQMEYFMLSLVDMIITWCGLLLFISCFLSICIMIDKEENVN